MDMPPNGFYRISPKGLILNETRDKFLIVQEEDGMWDLPGGGLDFGEASQDCLRREIKEEMGLDVLTVSNSPSYFFTDEFQSEARKGMWYANVLYEITVAGLDFIPSSECVAVKFVSPEEVSGLTTYNSITNLAKMFRKI